jgi:hypothetical protein
MTTLIEWSDRLGGAAGAIRLGFEDTSGVWRSSWYPTTGSVVSLKLGYSSSVAVDCGDFEIDEVELESAPDRIEIRAISAIITDAIRTANTAAFESTTVAGVANAIAQKYGLEFISAQSPTDVFFKRITQRYETDLQFLDRLAREFGYEFTIRGRQMVFYSRAALESVGAAVRIKRIETLRAAITDRTRRVYSSSSVAYQNGDLKTLFSGFAAASEATADTLKIVTRCENAAQASARALASLRRQNARSRTVWLEVPGNPAIVAGIVIALNGWGVFDANYLVESATHRITPHSGYTTTVSASMAAGS